MTQSIVFSQTRSPYEFELIFPDGRIKFKAHESTLTKKVTLIINQVGTCPLRLTPDDIVTKTEIAKRLGESVYLVRKFLIYDDEFPLPVENGRTIRWRWWDVAHWLIANKYEVETLPRRVTDIIGSFNMAFSVLKLLERKPCLRK